MKKFIVSISFCAAVLIFSTVKAFGCTCMMSKPVEDEYKRSTAIFSGEVVSNVKSGAYGRKVKIRIKNSWKGGAAKTVTISTSSTGAMCGYSFVRGKSYLIYADGDAKKGFSVSLCSRTKEFSDAKEDIEALNNLKQETKSAPK